MSRRIGHGLQLGAVYLVGEANPLQCQMKSVRRYQVKYREIVKTCLALPRQGGQLWLIIKGQQSSMSGILADTA